MIRLYYIIVALIILCSCQNKTSSENQNSEKTMQIKKSSFEYIKNKTDAGIISARFHNTIAHALLTTAIKARDKTNLNTTALSGGVFCNKFLTNNLIKLLKENNFEVLFKKNFPSNDGAVSLGQAAIAAKLNA